MNNQELKREGVEIARLCNWDGEKIVKIFQSALTDANFHKLSEDVIKAWNRDQKRP